MRILIDARLYGLENAGLGRYVMNLVSELVKIDKKNEYHLLLRQKYYKELKFPKNWHKVLADVKHYSLLEQIKIPGMISKISPDLTHFPHLNVPLTFKGKYVVTIHDIVMNKFNGTETTNLSLPMYYVKRIGYKKVFQKAIKDSEKIIVPSQFTKTELVNYYKINEDKVFVTYEGVSGLGAKPANSKDVLREYGLDDPYFLYVGNAYPHKNLKRVIRAVSDYNMKHSEKITFAIVSSRNVFTQRLEKMINESEAKSYVKLLGFVEDSKLNTLYKSAVGYVFPSLYEGFGLPGLEAMHAGCLVLASDTPIFKEIYKGKVMYFNPFDSNSIEMAIRDAIAMDPKKKAKMIKDAKDFVRRYSWGKMAKETLEVYNECVK